MTGALDRKRFSIIVLMVVVATFLLIAYLSWAFIYVIILSLFGAYILNFINNKL